MVLTPFLCSRAEIHVCICQQWYFEQELLFFAYESPCAARPNSMLDSTELPGAEFELKCRVNDFH